MIAAAEAQRQGVARFRTKLFLTMMVLVSTLTGLGLYLAQRNVTADAKRSLQQSFQGEIFSLDKLQELRHTALAQRCRDLVAKPRIHAALEDNALDLLYPSAQDELRDLMETGEPSVEQSASSLHARFYRFLNSAGAVLPPPNPKDVGDLSRDAELQLALSKLPEIQQLGYIFENNGTAHRNIDEIMAIPIFSSETGEVISALVVGFKPFELTERTSTGMKSGIWVDGRLHLPLLPIPAETDLGEEITKELMRSDRTQGSFRATLSDAPQLLFYKQLNPGSLFPPAYEICVYPLTNYTARLHTLRWKIGSAGALLLLAGLVASHFVADRLAKPVEKLEIESQEERAQRERAEDALALTSEELNRSARYSADASHQLKSPVTVLRAGLEELLRRNDFKPEVYEDLSALLHHTHRLTGVIDDLLLLSRMDAGHLQIESASVNLGELVEEWLDDLGALPDAPEVKIEKTIATGLYVAGEKRYTSLIVQNLLENARKYNRPGGRMVVDAGHDNNGVVLTVGNSGRAIPRSVQEHIFERFHTSNTSGHGLGLNLARELARLHGGDLKLVRSENDWTEFELRLRRAAPTTNRTGKTG